MRVIFMGTPEFSVGTLEALLEAGHQVVLAVTQPDKPKGRGGKMQYPPVKEAALTHGIPVYQPQKIRREECVQYLRDCPADIMVVVAFGQILPKQILEMAPYGCVNVHASLLPKYRGAAPIQWAIIRGETVTGVTTMQMDTGLDTGDMLLKKEVPVTAGETGGSLHDKLAQAGAELCVETLRQLEQGAITPKKQGESPTPYASMLTRELGRIDWSAESQTIDRLIRGLSPWPGTYTTWQGQTMKIWGARVQAAGDGQPPGTAGEAAGDTQPPGTVVKTGKTSFWVQTGKGTLEVLAVQIPGKRQMDAGAFMRGYQLQAGTLLGKEG